LFDAKAAYFGVRVAHILLEIRDTLGVRQPQKLEVLAWC
jgi:hypothetical protein